MDLRAITPAIVRYALAIVFLVFGLDQLIRPEYWLGYLPSWLPVLGLSETTLIVMNGIFDLVLGALLALGLFTRVAAAFGGLHLLGVMVSLGYNDIAVRDFGLLIVAIAILFHGPDDYSLDERFHGKVFH